MSNMKNVAKIEIFLHDPYSNALCTVDTQGTKMSDACNKVSIETSLDLSSSLGPRFVFNIWNFLHFMVSEMCSLLCLRFVFFSI